MYIFGIDVFVLATIKRLRYKKNNEKVGEMSSMFHETFFFDVVVPTRRSCDCRRDQSRLGPDVGYGSGISVMRPDGR